MNGIAELYKLADVTAGKPSPMMLFPIGDWTSAKYPELTLDQALADEVIANFEAEVLRTRVPVDTNHDPQSPANGWHDRLYMAPFEWQGVSGDALYADWIPNERGAQVVNDGEYAYDSVDIGDHVDPVTGNVYHNVLKATTLSNRPVLRMMPGVRDAGDALKLSEPVDFQLSEVTLAAIPEFIKVKMRAKWLKANPGKTEADVPENMKASEDPRSLAETDPVAAAVAALEDALTAANEALGGKLGIPVIRTYLREAIRKASAHAMTEDSGDHAEPIDAHSDDHSQLANVDERQPVALADGDAATKGSDPMKTVATKLNLAEDAPEALVLAEVVKLNERVTLAETERDEAVTRLAETEKAKRAGEVEVELTEIENAGNLKPGERAEFVLQAAEKPEVYASRLADRKALKPNTIIDKSVRGSGHEGDSGGAKRADVELYELATLKAAELKCDYGKAANLVLSENKGGIADRYRDLIDGREG